MMKTTKSQVFGNEDAHSKQAGIPNLWTAVPTVCETPHSFLNWKIYVGTTELFYDFIQIGQGLLVQNVQKPLE